jgi:hypothetical protein
MATQGHLATNGWIARIGLIVVGRTHENGLMGPLFRPHETPAACGSFAMNGTLRVITMATARYNNAVFYLLCEFA